MYVLVKKMLFYELIAFSLYTIVWACWGNFTGKQGLCWGGLLLIIQIEGRLSSSLFFIRRWQRSKSPPFHTLVSLTACNLVKQDFIDQVAAITSVTLGFSFSTRIELRKHIFKFHLLIFTIFTGLGHLLHLTAFNVKAVSTEVLHEFSLTLPKADHRLESKDADPFH